MVEYQFVLHFMRLLELRTRVKHTRDGASHRVSLTTSSAATGSSPTHAHHTAAPSTNTAAITPNTTLQFWFVRSRISPLTGTATRPAIVAQVFPVAKTKPACLGATSRCETLTPASVSAESARPTSTHAAAAKTLASATRPSRPPRPSHAAARRQTAGPTIPAAWNARRTKSVVAFFLR